MSRRTRLGIIAALVPVLVLAAVGVLALIPSEGSGGGSPLLPGFALARPSFVTGDKPAFPVDNAGLSAYVKLDPTSGDFATTGFDRIIQTVFTDMITAGDNYVIGKLPIAQAKWGAGSVEVQVYVDKDGWVVAYLRSGDLNANIFTWTRWDTANPKLETVVEEALNKIALAVGQDVDTIGWYDWAHPDATHFAAAARYGKGKMFMAIPTGDTTVYGEPSYSWDSWGRVDIISKNTGKLTMTKQGGTETTLEDHVGAPTSAIFNVSQMNMELGAMYTFTVYDGLRPEHLLGVVVCRVSAQLDTIEA